MYLPVALALLLSVLSTAQNVTDLDFCLTKQGNLRLDCKFQLPDSSLQHNCEFSEHAKVMGSTLPNTKPHPDYKDKANISETNGKLCTLSLSIVPEHLTQYTCKIILPDKSFSQSTAVHKTIIPTCSALSVLFQATNSLLWSVMSLPVLLELLST